MGTCPVSSWLYPGAGSQPRTWELGTLQRNIRVQNNQIQFIKDSKTNKESMAKTARDSAKSKRKKESGTQEPQPDQKKKSKNKNTERNKN